jgi:hypothetical protein
MFSGLYRGLKLKTAGTDLDVRVVSGASESELLRMQGPVILTVYLDRGENVDPRYARSLGWNPGVRHTVVLLGPAGRGKLLIADPADGLEEWSIGDLQTLWHGQGLRLVAR